MTTDALTLGIDVGTSGVRAIVMDTHGKQITMGGASTLAPLARPDNWWQACTSAMTAALDGIDASAIVALAIDGTSGTLLAIDAGGAPIGDALMYNEGSSDPVIKEHLKSHVPSGNPAGSATSGLGKAIELQQRPGVVQTIHQADWMIGKFTGDYTQSDENNALKSGYDPVNRLWPAWIDDVGMQRTLLPTVHPVATAVGTLSKAVIQQFGLSSDVVVYSGTTDGCASFLATGASLQGDAVTALGTTLTLKVLVEKPVFDSQYGVYSHRIGDLWLAGGASNTGGAVLDAHFTREQLIAVSELIDTDALLNLDYYPLPTTGERFPINDPDLQPRMTPRPDTDAQFLQGLFEGIASIEKLGFSRVTELSGTPLASIRSVGSGAANVQWTRLRQRIIDVPFAEAASTEAAAGAARLALTGYNKDNAA